MQQAKWFFLTLAVFCVVIGSVDFFHVEPGFVTDYNCPACLFQSTFFAAIRSLVVVIAFVLAFLIMLAEPKPRRLTRGSFRAVNNKSPPRA
ncbi:MAG: hypothetical protein RB296_00215 [Acidobacteriota bacterium]|jgi:hypothetical protein|nr:hypothetical protein [Acidobacteriota bacterium]